MHEALKQLPNSPNEVAARTVPMAQDQRSEAGISQVSKYLAEIGRKGGLKGGNARAKKLSASKRKEIAKKAANARWGNRSKSWLPFKATIKLTQKSVG